MNPVLYFKDMVSFEENIKMPIYVKNFTAVGSFNITVNYDKDMLELVAAPTQLECKNGTLGTNNTVIGEIKFGWFTYPALTLPDEAVLLNLNFKRKQSGITDVTFVTDFGLSNENYEPIKNTEYINRILTLKEKVMEKITFIYTMISQKLTIGQTVEFPVKYTGAEGVTAISLVLRYLNDAIEIQDVTCDKATENFLTGKPFPNELRIGWFGQTPIKDFTIVIKAKILRDIPLNEVIKFVTYEADPINPLNELAGEDYEGMEGVVLETVSLTQKATVAAKKAYQEYVGKPAHPSCSTCKNYDGVKRCGVGGFVVAKKGLCKLFEKL